LIPEAIKKAIPGANIQYKLMPLNAELAKQRIKADIAAGVNRANVSEETIDRHAASYPQMLEDIKTEGITEYKPASVSADVKTTKVVTVDGVRNTINPVVNENGESNKRLHSKALNKHFSGQKDYILITIK